MSITNSTVLSLVVVLDKVSDRSVVWRVNVGQAVGLSRLPGAWVAGDGQVDVITSLFAGYRVVWCDDVSEGIDDADTVDRDATVDAASAEVEAVGELFTNHRESLANKLIRPLPVQVR